MKLRLPSGGHFPRRLPWVRYYLEEAGIFFRRGCIVTYLPRESVVKPRSDGLPYAIKTRDIVGEWRGRMMYDNRGIRFVLGADSEFPGIDVIARNFDKALDGRFKIYKTLDETVAAAIKLVMKGE